MADLFSERRKGLLRHLQRHKSGATIEELVLALGVTRTAVRQHLASLVHDGFVMPGAERPSGGRPGRLYVLTDDKPGDEKIEARVVEIGITDGINTVLKTDLGDAKVVTDETDDASKPKNTRGRMF